MTTDATVNFSGLIELILARLYDLERGARPGTMFDLNAVAKDLRVQIPTQWIFDAGKVLESRGWAEVLFTFGGGCHARLTGEGRIYVEEEHGKGLIREYHEAPRRFFSADPDPAGRDVTSATRSQHATIEREREPALELLRQMDDVLRHEASVTEDQRADLLIDVEMIERQMRKREPNRAALAALLEPLSRVPSLSAPVMDLIRLFNNP
jgi:hypothetical protein